MPSHYISDSLKVSFNSATDPSLYRENIICVEAAVLNSDGL